MVFDLAAFRAKQAQVNAALLDSLEVSIPSAPAIPAAQPTPSPSPIKKPRTPKASPRPSPPASAEALVKDRETRGLRSSGRIRDGLLGLTPKKETRRASVGSDGEADEETVGKAVATPLRRTPRRYDPKQYGPIPGVKVNDVCGSRQEWHDAAVHAGFVQGIATGKPVQGAPSVASICTGGSNYGDADHGYSLTYSGSGGRDLTGTAEKRKNLRTAPQSANMRWDDNPRNLALLHSVKTQKPIRVLRSYKGGSAYAPKEGYIYSGLYVAVKAWTDKNEDGFDVCRVALVRMPGQPPLAVHPDRAHLVSAPSAMPAQLLSFPLTHDFELV
ncbi:hypothetical protein JCM10449v2_000524 [Rhodotorula kratochvilovae]